MTEVALVLMAVLFGVVLFALGLALGFYASAHWVSKRIADAMGAAGIDRETRERIVMGIKRGDKPA